MRGGWRRRHVQPVLGPREVEVVREMRHLGVPYKTMVALFQVCRETLSRAVNATRTYGS